MKIIAVFFGGESVEHDVSVITGVMTLNSVDKKFLAVPVYVHNDGSWYTGDQLKDVSFYKKFDAKKLKKVTLLGGDNALYQIKGKKLKKLQSISVAINCMHGERGEDGSLSGLLRMCKIPLASPSILASSVCMDKSATKIFLKGIGVKHLPAITVNKASDLEGREGQIEYPVIVKPATLGSSIGIKTATCFEELFSAVIFATKYSRRVVIEKLLSPVTEINCAIYKDAKGIHVSECEKPSFSGEILDFDDKYTKGQREFPANIDNITSQKIKRIAKKIYTHLDVDGIIRIDFLVHNSTVYVNEINTVPGSLAYYLFVENTGEFCDLLSGIIRFSEEKFLRDETLVRSYSTTLLNIKGAKGSKTLEKTRRV